MKLFEETRSKYLAEILNPSRLTRICDIGANPVTWAEAGTEVDILKSLQGYPDIRLAAMGAGLDDVTRGRLIAVIAAARPDVTIHLKDRASGPGGMAEFVVKLISTFLTNEATA